MNPHPLAAFRVAESSKANLDKTARLEQSQFSLPPRYTLEYTMRATKEMKRERLSYCYRVETLSLPRMYVSLLEHFQVPALHDAGLGSDSSKGQLCEEDARVSGDRNRVRVLPAAGREAWANQ